MTCAQGLLRLLWGGAQSWSATGLITFPIISGNIRVYSFVLFCFIGEQLNLFEKIASTSL